MNHIEHQNYMTELSNLWHSLQTMPQGKGYQVGRCSIGRESRKSYNVHLGRQSWTCPDHAMAIAQAWALSGKAPA